MSALVLLLLVCASACALPSNKNFIQDVEARNPLDVIGSANKPTTPSTGRRLSSLGIMGGNKTAIDMYPFAASLLASFDLETYTCVCGGTILNTRSVLTAADCYTNKMKAMRFRVGSVWSSGGGAVYNMVAFIAHPGDNETNHSDFNIAIVRSATTIVYVPHAVQPAVTAPADYNLADNEKVWSIGWGSLQEFDFSLQDHLRHVRIYTINQNVCEKQYTRYDPNDGHGNVTENMLCAGVPEGGKGACVGDNGAPLIHNGVVIGIYSWQIGCGRRLYPSVYTRVSRFAEWIEKNK